MCRGLVVLVCWALGILPAQGADPSKVLHVAFSIAETSFDPQFASDAASDSVIANIFEAMLDYDYLARPVQLVPRTLEAMPAVSDSGATYLCRVRKGIYFTADPAFGGRPRELTAADHAYALKRLLDPAVKSPWLWLVEGKIVGGDEARERARKSGRFDYDAPIPGIEIVDRYTLRIRLRAPDLRFLYALAVPNTGAIAREVVERYGRDIGAHPVGSGPYMLGGYKRSSRIELIANPQYRETTYVPSAALTPEMQATARSLQGQRLPRIGRIDISIIEEGQSRWLAFLNGQSDVLELLPAAFVEQALDARGRMRPELAAKGIRHEELLRPNVWFAFFNMDDPVVGGYTREKIALRRAIGMAFNAEEAIRVLRHGRSLPAQGPVPPGIAGYDPKLRTDAQRYDPAAARALLDRFGYVDRNGDGYREKPDGTPLVIERWSSPTSAQRQEDELWKRNLDAIGVRLEIRHDRTPELRKMMREGRVPFGHDGWNADYPDAENFMQLLYGPNANRARRTMHDFACPSSTGSTTRRARCPIHPRARRCSIAWRTSWSRTPPGG